jgi:LPPG:FO 2-phospho-L-lactate transferase
VALKVAALAGGVGGAKLLDGLASVLPADHLTAVVNTGDDFDHLGLRICPDLDTVLYTLAGLANPQTGWGRANETWGFLETLKSMGGEDWFRLGDKDLAIHVLRTQALHQGVPLSRFTGQISADLGVTISILPMSDDPIPTIVESDEGDLPFQVYFVAKRCEPKVRGFRFEGAERARPAPGVLDALMQADVIVLCPSNPWVSLDPILAVPGVRQAVAARPVIGVSPIVGGRAIKGPAAKMFRELGLKAEALAVAEHFKDVLGALVIDKQDEDQAEPIRHMGIETLVADTIMIDRAARASLAEDVLAWSDTMVRMETKA